MNVREAVSDKSAPLIIVGRAELIQDRPGHSNVDIRAPTSLPSECPTRVDPLDRKLVKDRQDVVPDSGNAESTRLVLPPCPR